VAVGDEGAYAEFGGERHRVILALFRCSEVGRLGMGCDLAKLSIADWATERNSTNYLS
jgi:hypothetical protein